MYQFEATVAVVAAIFAGAAFILTAIEYSDRKISKRAFLIGLILIALTLPCVFSDTPAKDAESLRSEGFTVLELSALNSDALVSVKGIDYQCDYRYDDDGKAFIDKVDCYEVPVTPPPHKSSPNEFGER